MTKRIIIIIIIAIIATGATFFFTSSMGDNANDKQADQQSKKPSPDTENKEVPNTESSLGNIFDLAKQGKIPVSNIVVGEATADKVQEAWEDLDETTDTVVGPFLNYLSHDINVGITGDIVSDLRSSQDQFTSFDLDHISLSKKISENGVNGEKDDASGDTDNGSMSLDEKIGQMIFSGVNGTEMTAETKNNIQKYHVGGIILFANNINSKNQTVNFLNEMKTANADNPYPLLLGVDEEGGSVTRMPDEIKSLPTSRSIGKLNDPDVSFNVGTILGKQMKALGLNLDFAPVLDVNSNPDNPVIGDRSFGDNPNIVTKLGIQTMKGIQNEGIISVMKHFPGHGDTGEDSHLELPKVNKSYEQFSKLELVPFKKAISEGADVSMVAHILLPKIDEDYPASMSKEVITGILREDYAFDGVVITDDLTMEAITDHYSIADAAVQSVKAGGDLLLVAHDPNLIATVFDKLKGAVEDGEISEDRIDESVERITHLKAEYQLSDEKTPIPNFQSINEKVEAILQEVS